MVPGLAIVPILGLALGAACLAPASFAAAPRTLVLSGRLADADGWPLAGGVVEVRAARTQTVRANADGRYAVTVPLGAFELLGQRPLRIEVGASDGRRRLVTAAGASQLAFELSVVPSDSGGPRLRVRASEAAPAVAIAHSLSLDDGRGAEVALHFVAATSPPRDGVELIAEQVVPVRGLPLGDVRFDAEAPAAPAVRREAPPARPRDVPTREPAARATATRTPESRPPATRASDTRAEDAKVRAARAAAVRDSVRKARERERADRAAMIENERLIAAAIARREKAVRDSLREAAKTQSAARRPTPSREIATQAPRATPSPHRATEAPRAAAPPPHPATRATAAERLRQRTAAATTGRSGDLAAKPDSTPARVSATRSTAPPGASVRRIEGGGAPPRSSQAGANTPGASTRVWAGQTTGPDETQTPAVEPGEGCWCRVDGTIEIRAPRRQAAPIRIEVSLADHGMPRDTVSIDVGAPRPFVLVGVPCGEQRLEFRSLSGHALRWVSREVLEPFECQRGHRIHPRAVLQPR